MQTNSAERSALTRNSHAIAPIQRVPNHWPISYRNKGFWKVFWVGGEGIQGDTRPTQNDSLEAW